MRLKLYLFLAQSQAQALVRDGFPDSARTYRLSPAEYTACSAFNPQSLVEVTVELERAELQRYRRELELPQVDDAADEDEFGAAEAEPIYWYELPANVLCKACCSSRIITGRR